MVAFVNEVVAVLLQNLSKPVPVFQFDQMGNSLVKMIMFKKPLGGLLQKLSVTGRVM